MALEAARVLERLNVGHVVLHGGLPGPQRKAVLERFQTDPACRVFVSTDAGGTGLNLQAADTVVNLELPWNPAVLEQRIARAHRMGQERPVRVINFVTRGTIEEKVMRTLEAKQQMFAGLFDGDADEIPFEATNTRGFVESMRDLVGTDEEQWAESSGQKDAKPAPAVAAPALAGATDMWAGVVQIVEGACALLSAPAARGHLPPDVRERLAAALRAIGETH